MSVKLVIVALLAAAAVTTPASAAEEKTIVTVKYCTTGDTCDCTDGRNETFVVGACTNINGKHFKVDECEDSSEKVVVKGYTTEECEAFIVEKSTSECTPYQYDMAECTGTTVKLSKGCDMDKSNQCVTCDDAPVTFDTTDGNCKKWKDNYLKLESVNCDSGDTITFKNYGATDSTCSGDSPTDLFIKKACTASLFFKFGCDADNKKGVVKLCPDSDCNTGCGTGEEYPFGKDKVAGENQVWVLDTCANTDAKLTFKEYATVDTYTKTCTSGRQGNTMAICNKTTTSDDGNNEPSGSSTEPSSTEPSSTTASAIDGNNNSNNSDNDGNNNSNNSDNDGNSGSSVPASAHFVGVLALVLCLLACAY